MMPQKIGYHCPFPLTPGELSHDLDELPSQEMKHLEILLQPQASKES